MSDATAGASSIVSVIVAGALGKMGRATVAAIEAAPKLRLAARVDPGYKNAPEPRCFTTLEEAYALEGVQTSPSDVLDAFSPPPVLVDFTRPDAVEANLRTALAAGLNCVVGTTGLASDILSELEALIPPRRCLFIAPNFAIGAVLLMQAAHRIARFLPDAEIIELHHNHKCDAPSGTALRTAELIAAGRTAGSDYHTTAPGTESELSGCEGARGAMVDDVPIHSVRLPGMVAHEEVIFGGLGQTLTLRHDSLDRRSFMPGVVLACEEVGKHTGLIIGLEHFLDDA